MFFDFIIYITKNEKGETLLIQFSMYIIVCMYNDSKKYYYYGYIIQYRRSYYATYYSYSSRCVAASSSCFSLPDVVHSIVDCRYAYNMVKSMHYTLYIYN